MHNMCMESAWEYNLSLSERGFINGGPGQATWDTKGEGGRGGYKEQHERQGLTQAKKKKKNP